MTERERQLQELLETVDILKLIAMKGSGEVKAFARYMVVWGLYAAVNIALELLFDLSLWYPLLYLAFFTTTVPVAGWGASALAWLLAAAFSYGVFALTHLGWLTVLAIGLSAALSYGFLYNLGVRKRRYRPFPLKLSVAPKIGWSWGVLMAGMAIVFFSILKFIPPDQTGRVSIILWGYALGVGLFISGAIAPGFFLLGILTIFGVPLAASISPTLGVWAYFLAALAMAGYGGFLLKRSDQTGGQP